MIIWTKIEIEYLIKTIQSDPEYGAWMIEQAMQKAWDHDIKIDWYNVNGVLNKWEEKENTAQSSTG